MEKKNLNEMIGVNFKKIRYERGLSLEKTAKQTGVSKPMLGQIERGISNPTVSTLWKIATGLGVPFTAFFEENEDKVRIVKKQQLQPITEADNRYLVYPLFPMEEGTPFEIFSVHLKPGCRHLSAPHPRGVQEHIWVEEGNLALNIDGKNYCVSAKEGIRFVADCPHTYSNPGDQLCTATLIIHYPQI